MWVNTSLFNCFLLHEPLLQSLLLSSMLSLALVYSSLSSLVVVVVVVFVCLFFLWFLSMGVVADGFRSLFSANASLMSIKFSVSVSLQILMCCIHFFLQPKKKKKKPSHFPLHVFFELWIILKLCCLISKYLKIWGLVFIYSLLIIRQHTRYSLHPLTLQCFNTEIWCIFINAPHAWTRLKVCIMLLAEV